MELTPRPAAAAHYATRVDAVLAQRTRFRGPQPPGDLFAGVPPDHPLMKSDARRPLDPNLEVIASYVEPNDVVVDVGGGSGRMSLPLALRCREVIAVDASAAMGAGFAANAAQAGITNARFVNGDWLTVEPPIGTVALVNHVTYLTREIMPFFQKLERAGTRRVMITVHSPPPPSWNRVLYRLFYGEAEEVVPGHAELFDVLWEMGILPDVRVLSPMPSSLVIGPAPTREAAIMTAVRGFPAEQWALWPLGPELENRLRDLLTSRFADLFTETTEGFLPRWRMSGREVLLTWQPSVDRAPREPTISRA